MNPALLKITVLNFIIKIKIEKRRAG